MHVVLPQNLLDRLLYHDVAAYGIQPNTSIDHIRELRSPDYLFYATSVISVFQIAEVRGTFLPSSIQMAVNHDRFIVARRIE